MKFLFTTLAYLSPFLILAQPSWTSANEPKIGDETSYYVIDSNTTNLSASKGQNVTWDYSNITTYSFDGLLKGAADDVSNSDYASFYTLASHDEYIDGHFHNFYKIATTGRVNYGYQFTEPAANLNALIIYDAIETRTYPFAYPDIKSGNFTNANIVMYPNTIQEMTITADGSYSVEADAFGTLTLVDSVIPDVLRINTRDSVFADVALLNTTVTIIRNQYEYIQDGNPFPIFTHSDVRLYGSLFNRDFTLVMSQLKPTVSTGVNEIDTESAHLIYPNPSKTQIHIDNLEMNLKSVGIFDLNGNKVISVQSQLQSQTIKVNIEKLDRGMYFVRLIDRNEQLQTQKLMVN